MGPHEIFLDRDGTINVEKNYLHLAKDWEWIPGAVEALIRFKSAGYLLIVISNQAGLARGYYSESDLLDLHSWVNQQLSPRHAEIDAFYFCPHHPDFSKEECDIAVELVDNRLAKGMASGYFFLFAEEGSRLLGYTCFGPLPGSSHSFDLYWIVTHQDWRAKGIGKKLLDETIIEVKKLNGRMLIAETSTKEQYIPTRKFYENNNFLLEATIVDFYEIGDGKAMFVKRFV